jgi:hypothetical protein
MELIAVTLARLACFFELQGLDPFGKTADLQAIKELAKRYSFEKWPQTFAELDLAKGIELSAGTCNGINVDKISLYTNGIAVDTRSSTDDCESVLNDLFGAATEMLGAKIKPYRRMFVSQLVFQSEMRLTALNPVLQKIVDRLNTYVSADLEQPFVFDSNVVMNADLSQTKLTPGAFTIERRADAPFKAKTYFSSAPLRTSVHLELLQEFEDALKGTGLSDSGVKKPSRAYRLQEE